MPMPPKKPDENLEEWMTTYSDMVTLLLCFFVMLLAASKVDTVMFEQIRTGISRDFMDKKVEQPVSMLVADLSSDIKTLKMDKEALLGSDHIGVTLDLEADTFFDSGSAELKAAAYPILRKLAATLKEPRYSLFRFDTHGAIPVKLGIVVRPRVRRCPRSDSRRIGRNAFARRRHVGHSAALSQPRRLRQSHSAQPATQPPRFVAYGSRLQIITLFRYSKNDKAVSS